MGGLFDVTNAALEVALQGTEQRQAVLSNNLANVNTPGFKRSDVSFQDSLASALAGGSSSPEDVSGVQATTTVESGTSMRADGNNVDVDRESVNLAENQILFDTVMAIDTKRLQTLAGLITSAR